MPVRSLDSSVLKWPDARAVDRAVRKWAEEIVSKTPGVVCIGYFGSYARGDWGVGSDLDIVMVIERSDLPLAQRAGKWDTTDLPVPADLLVYTLEEWREVIKRGRFGETLRKEVVWVYQRDRRCGTPER
ncbi:MAG: nucleotidyltransferase domain-containing protein [Deltaproteobacteria bacterium]|nr:MAG: nucleotidyltransferase domain-containing protein [Deltaproteobacteria bacterium]